MKANAAAMPERETTLLKRLEFVRWILEIASHTVASHKSKSLGLKSKSKSESLVFKSESKSKSPKTVLESDSSPSTWLEYYKSALKKMSLIGQVNKKLCLFSNVKSRTKSKLVESYCTSFYGAEIWDLFNNKIESICTAWRKGIRRIWQVPNTTHSALIPGLCDTVPLVDLFYKRMLNFVYRCLRSESPIVNFTVRHGMSFGLMDSTIGRNVLNCSLRYNTSIECINNLEFRSYSIRTASTNVLASAKITWTLLLCWSNLFNAETELCV